MSFKIFYLEPKKGKEKTSLSKIREETDLKMACRSETPDAQSALEKFRGK